MNALQQQLAFTGCALVCAGIGSIHDVRTRRIPNRVTGPAILAGLVLHSICGGWSGVFDSSIAALIAGSVCLIFWLAGGMGAGDVKLMTAVGCIAGFARLGTLLISISITAALFGIAVSMRDGRLRKTLSNVVNLVEHHRRNGLQPHPNLNVTNSETICMPFAVPIAVGCLVTLCTLAWEAHS